MDKYEKLEAYIRSLEKKYGPLMTTPWTNKDYELIDEIEDKIFTKSEELGIDLDSNDDENGGDCTLKQPKPPSPSGEGLFIPIIFMNIIAKIKK